MDITPEDLAAISWDISALLSDRRDEYPSLADLDVSDVDIAAALPAFLDALRAAQTRRENPDPHADAPRNQDGTYKHTCNGDNLSGLPFGRKAPEGECARCDELRNGAEPRARFGGRKTRAQRDAEQCADLEHHFASERHRSGGCGLVCTFGDS